MTAENVYWISVLAKFCDLAQIIPTLGIIWVIGAVAARCCGADPKEYPLFGWGYTAIIAILSVSLWAFVPTGKTVWATYVIPYIDGNVQVLKNVPEDVLKDLK